MSNNGFFNKAGWDIGGAHVKLAYVDSNSLQVRQWSCPLWKGLSELTQVLEAAFKSIPRHIQKHNVTMTGELVDLFLNREDGVKKIIHTFAQSLPSEHSVHYFSTSGLMSVEQAIANTVKVASANWVASGRSLSRICENAVFVDIGSTTTDVLLISNGALVLNGFTDFERLRSGELVYTGVVRSCVNTICNEFVYKNDSIPMIAENFSVTADVYRILECLPDYADYGDTMDGKPKNKESSMRRLARMIGEDFRSADADEWVSVSRYLADKQKEKIQQSVEVILKNKEISEIVGAGVGRFLVEQISTDLSLPYTDFSEKILPSNITFQPNASDCAPAIALLFESSDA